MDAQRKSAQTAAQVVDGCGVVLGVRDTARRVPGQLCATCQERRARLRESAVARAARPYAWCLECYRAERARRRGLAGERPARLVPLSSARPAPSKCRPNREQLYAELLTRRRQAVLMARFALERAPEAGEAATVESPTRLAS
jgi:hypothetical protein